MASPTTYGVYLWLFTLLLTARVIGQLVVATTAPRWLPPMEQWQSGLLPYPVLVACQAIVLALMIWISTDFWQRSGYWVQQHPRLGTAALWWSCLYFGAMVVRYAVRMARRPGQRWLGGTIPIVFHCVVAAFQWIFAAYHRG